MKQLIDLVQVLVFNLTTPCRQEVPQEGGVCIRSYIYVYIKGGIYATIPQKKSWVISSRISKNGGANKIDYLLVCSMRSNC
jgi:hypothetical protein